MWVYNIGEMQPDGGQYSRSDVEEGELSGQPPSYPNPHDSLPTHHPNLHPPPPPPPPPPDSESQYIFQTVHQQQPHTTDKRRNRHNPDPRSRPHNTPSKERRPTSAEQSKPNSGYYHPPPYLVGHGDNPAINPYPPPPSNYLKYPNNQNYYPHYPPPHYPAHSHSHHYTNIQYKIPLQPRRNNNYPPPQPDNYSIRPDSSYVPSYYPSHSYPSCPPPPTPRHRPHPDPQRRAYLYAIRREILSNIDDFNHPDTTDIIETVKCILKFDKLRQGKGESAIVAQECYERSLGRVEEWLEGSDLNIRAFIRGLLDAMQMGDVLLRVNELKLERKEREASGRSEMKKMLDALVRHPKRMIF